MQIIRKLQHIYAILAQNFLCSLWIAASQAQ